MEPCTVTINGRRWRLKFDRLRDRDGDCDDPSTPHKAIRLATSLRSRPRRLLEVLIHECLHAADWSKDETWIEKCSEDIARVLIKMGYRRTDAQPTDDGG